ncbi:MAG: ABC transporter permease [Actinobacteria bacterium]|uniref:Unannotated protein n=1 Tax=freshwater metagenome TaxID=449393 RepID=A0A6J5YNA0_9ZZZZ|nr:ABC transporter permease [Actinomycetota bacterium]
MSQIESGKELAERFGLQSASATAPIGEYLKQVWIRRDFIRELALARSTQQYSDSWLGRLWQLVTPILNAGIYYLIFGVLLGTRKGIDNFTAFLIAGVFAFNFMQTAITAAESCLAKNEKLVQAIHFPRLVLPLATTLQQVQQYFVSLCVLIVIVIATGEPITTSWLLLPVALFLQLLFTLGLSLMMARLGSKSRDLSQLLPFFMRTWRYISGVFFSIIVFTTQFPNFVGRALQLNPGAVYLDLIRDALMVSQQVDAAIWVSGVLWAVVTFVLGVVYFYRGEDQYV